jgi:hypothetical protein
MFLRVSFEEFDFLGGQLQCQFSRWHTSLSFFLQPQTVSR